MAKRRKLRPVRVDPKSYTWTEGLMAVCDYPYCESPCMRKCDLSAPGLRDTDHQDSGLAEEG